MFNNIDVLENEDLSFHTTFKIGGCAKFFINPKDERELKIVLDECQKNSIKTFIIGNGSNLLVSSHGFDGAIICLKNFDKIKQVKTKDSTTLSVGAGVNLFKLNSYCLKNRLGGMEWSFGIPGSIGGAIKMNAGAFGHSFSEFIEEIRVLKEGKIKILKNIAFSYRTSNLTSEIILSAKLKLFHNDKEEISRNMQDFFIKRKTFQPYDQPSAGSVFKHGEAFIPAKLIDEWGLKGLRIGDAMISTKHAGFIVNLGSATSKDVEKLIEIIKTIANSKGFDFQEEIVFLK